MAKYMIIDGIRADFDQEKNILQVINSVGIHVPTLCYYSDLSIYGACRMCMVEDERGNLIASCSTPPKDKMVIRTNTPRLQHHRKMILELLLAAHCRDCTICEKNQTCRLQELAGRLGLTDVRFPNTREAQPVDDSSVSIVRDPSKCILCGDCVRVCNEVQHVGAIDFANRGSSMIVTPAFGKKLAETNCVNCGQCAAVCPTAAIKVKTNLDKVWRQLYDPGKRVVVQVAPAVRVALGEAFGLAPGEDSIGKIFTAIRMLGFDAVYDTCVGADLTIMEEAKELGEKLESGDDRFPLFTSCCPGWIRFVKTQFPHMVKYLSTAKSPQQMFGAVMKTYYAQKLGVDPERIFTVSIMPCVAKKAEREMELFYEEYAGHDVDAVLTTRELVRMIRSAHIRPEGLNDIESDSPMREGTGAGVIFGATGGVMEAALRTAYFALKGKNAPADAFRAVRSLGFNANNGVQEAEFKIDDLVLRTAAVSGLGNTRALLERIDRGEVHYDFVEVMACPGGCVGGGGQPIHDGKELAFERGRQLYYLDAGARLRYSHENPDVKAMYEEFFEKPNSHKAHLLLHTEHRK